MRISDWSSDVCSSDLDTQGHYSGNMTSVQKPSYGRRHVGECCICLVCSSPKWPYGAPLIPIAVPFQRVVGLDHGSAEVARLVVREIGRASCRERVCQYV